MYAIRSYYAGGHQRMHEHDETTGVTPRHGHLLGLAHALALAGVELGQAINPGRMRAVRGTGIEKAGAGVPLSYNFV